MLPDDLRLLILEHPTRGLDVESARWVWSRLLQRREQGTAIIFTSTDLDELMDHSDRIVVFSGGVMFPPVAADKMTREELGSYDRGTVPVMAKERRAPTLPDCRDRSCVLALCVAPFLLALLFTTLILFFAGADPLGGHGQHPGGRF